MTMIDEVVGAVADDRKHFSILCRPDASFHDTSDSGEKGKAMAYERLFERFLNAKHDHIAAYAVGTRGYTRKLPDKDVVLLTALAYEVEDSLRSLPRARPTEELRRRLIYNFLRQVPEASLIESSRVGDAFSADVPSTPPYSPRRSTTRNDTPLSRIV